ncbi:MAG: hypothetical protein ABH839_04415 [Chloroflexota bacterium]
MMDFEKEKMVDISLLLNQIGKSTDQVLENCTEFGAVLPPDNMHIPGFDASISFTNYFKLEDYIAFSAIGINFIKGNAVECIISLGKPVNPEYYSSEYEVLKIISRAFQELFQNGRIQEDSQEGRVYTWKSGNILLSLISYTDIDISSGVSIGVQIRDFQNHSFGSELKQLYEKAPKIGRIRD